MARGYSDGGADSVLVGEPFVEDGGDAPVVAEQEGAGDGSGDGEDVRDFGNIGLLELFHRFLFEDRVVFLGIDLVVVAAAFGRICGGVFGRIVGACVVGVLLRIHGICGSEGA